MSFNLGHPYNEGNFTRPYNANDNNLQQMGCLDIHRQPVTYNYSSFFDDDEKDPKDKEDDIEDKVKDKTEGSKIAESNTDSKNPVKTNLKINQGAEEVSETISSSTETEVQDDQGITSDQDNILNDQIVTADEPMSNEQPVESEGLYGKFKVDVDGDEEVFIEIIPVNDFLYQDEYEDIIVLQDPCW